MDDDLKHYGVKGMKWGIRRDRRSLSRSSSSKKDNSTSKIASVTNKGKEFVKRNKRTLISVGITSGLAATGLAWLTGPAMAAYNISATELHNYMLRDGVPYEPNSQYYSRGRAY